MAGKKSTDIAIIGLSCVFPKAPDIQSYWQNIVNKRNAISEPPADRGIDEVFAETVNSNDRISCRRGGYIDDLTDFKPVDFGIMPVAVDGAEPEHFMALKVADAALKDAGFDTLPFNRKNFEVIVGRGTFVNRGYVNLLQHGLIVDQTLNLLKQLHPDIKKSTLVDLKKSLKKGLPSFSPETAPGLASSVMTGIIANRMDLQGRNYTVDAACASALIALENAVQDLVAGHCDAALVGAIQISTPPVIHMLFQQLGALSGHESLKPFDEATDGTMLGEGVGMMVLKRLDDAIRDGHRIYAVVKGVASSSDGKAKGLLAPRQEGEELALRRAYERADVEPDSIGLIEAHGTGLRLGDATEIAALGCVFGNVGQRVNKTAVGTVKSMIGHLIPAAGIAGLIKTALALYHKTLPPTLSIDNPRKDLGIESTPLYLNTQTRPWIHGLVSPRRAGVNAFGFGGIDAHAILEEYREADGLAAEEVRLDRERESECIGIAAESRSALITACESAINCLRANVDAAFVDIAFTLCDEFTTTDQKNVKVGIVATDCTDLEKKLLTTIKRLKEPDRTQIKDRGGVFFTDSPLHEKGKLALLFPGEGSQYLNMLQDLSLAFPVVRDTFDLLDRAFADHPRGFVPSEFVYPPPLSDQTLAEDRLFQMDGAVDAVITADRALFRLLKSLGIHADAIVGHSSGEIMALEAAGAISIKDDEELIHFVREGNKSIEALGRSNNIPEAKLLAVGGVERSDINAVVEASHGRIIVAMENCPQQFVLCGKETDFADVMELLAEKGGICQPLPFSRAYHTEYFEPALGPLKTFFDTLPIVTPQIPLYSCLSAERFPDTAEAIKELAVLQWARPVRFTDTIRKMYQDGIRIFLEVGPRSHLTGFASDILKGTDALIVATNSNRKSGIGQLHLMLSQLFSHGVPVSLSALYDSRQPQRLSFSSTTQVQAQKIKKSGMKLELGLPVLKLEQEKAAEIAALLNPVSSPGVTGQVGETQDDGTTAVINEYMNTMDAFLQLQKQTMQQAMGIPETSISTVGSLQGRVVSHLDDQVTVHHCFDLQRYSFLQHHTLGGLISKYDVDLVALPVLPLSIAIEVMAEVAAHLLPDFNLTKITNVEITEWLLIEDLQPLQLETSAQVIGQGQIDIHLKLIEGETLRHAASCQCHMEPQVTIPKGSEHRMISERISIGEEQSLKLDADKLYPNALFHGPAFQSVIAVDKIGRSGIKAQLQMPDKDWFELGSEEEFVAQPILIDAIGQTIGLWLENQCSENIVAFPVCIDAIEFLGASISWQKKSVSHVSIKSLDSDTPLQLQSDALVFNEQEELVLKISGLRHRRIVMPNLFHHYRGSRQVRLTRPLALQLNSGQSVNVHCNDRIGKDFWWSDAAIWQKVLAYIVLSRRERLLWLPWTDTNARCEWLLRLVAVKEAVVELLQKQSNIAVFCADVEVDILEDNSIIVGGSWLQADVASPRVETYKMTNTEGTLVDIAYASWDLKGSAEVTTQLNDLLVNS